MTNGWSDQELNTQIDKDLNPLGTRPSFHREMIYTLVHLKYNITNIPKNTTYQNIWGKTKVRPIFMP